MNELFPDVAGGYAADARASLGGEARDGASWLRVLGATSLALAFAGLFLPLLPTTPFVLLAAWAFARSSPRLRSWLESHPRFGPPLRDWESRGAVPRRAKAAAVAGMSSSWVLLTVSLDQALVSAAAGAFMLAVAAYLVTRPS